MRPTWMMDSNLFERVYTEFASKFRKGVIPWIMRFWSRLFSWP